ncbi:unnamed protein product, partial [Phaeothamnion confervicola]
MDIDEFFHREVNTIHLGCARCRTYDEQKIVSAPAWVLELERGLQSSRRANLLRILQEANAVVFEPVTPLDVAAMFEFEVISGAGPYPPLLSDILDACSAGVSTGVHAGMDLSALPTEALERVNAAFSLHPDYIHRVIGLLKHTRAHSTIPQIYDAVQ